jgi:hypothetical protein
MNDKRHLDAAALAAQFQRQSEAALTDTSSGPAVARPGVSNFLVPRPAPRAMQALPTSDAVQQIDVAPAATVQTVVSTSQVDHSKGFLIRTLPLALAFSIAALVVTVGLLAVPLMSLRTLVVIFVTFAAVYAWAFWQDLKTSPAGIALYHTQNLWKHIHAERKFRHDWYRDERKEIQK